MANQMISAFTPSLMSPQELETILVQRQDLAQELFEKILLSATTPAKHYALLIGMRGMGKTHLVALIYYRLLAEFDRNPTLKDKLVIAWLREEEWGVDSWLDLVSRILRALAVEEPQSKSLLEELRRISIEDSIDRAAANATRLLKEAIGNRTLLLIMENLDDLFKGLGEAGQQQFRSFLQAEQCCTILATTPALFTAVQSRTKPFFGFFNPIYLDRLTVPEAIEMLGKIATLGGQEDLASFLQTPLGRARVRAVHHLAGGNPRVYMLFSQFITRDALDSLVQAFMKMLDDLTPYYQARMKELSNQQRKIVELLVDRRHPVMVKEIAADCFIDAGTAASQLRELRRLGYVEAEQNGRESFYELREVLMRLCLEVKKQRGQWVEIFVEFLKIWYPLSERKHQLELMRGTSQYIKDEHLERALLSDEDPCFVSSQRDLQRALKEQQQLLATETLEELFDSQRLTEENYQKLVELVQTDRYSEAQKLLLETVSQKDRSVEKFERIFVLQLLEGVELLEAEKNLEALELFDAVLAEDKSDVAWFLRGIALHKSERYEEAIASYDRAISINPNDDKSWSLRGEALCKLEKYEEAIASYERAIDFKPDDHQAWYNRGVTLSNLGRHEEAIASYGRAIDFKPDDHESWNNQGVTLSNLGRYEEAIASYERAIEFKPDYHEAWNNQGNALSNLGRYEEAITSCERAIDFKSDFHTAWYNRGIALGNLGRYEEAIASYERAIDFKPDLHEAWHNKGSAYFKWGKYVESAYYYNQAIDIKPDKYDSWHDKGVVQFVMGNYEDALNSWQQTFQIIQQLTSRPNNIARHIQEFLEELIPRCSLPNSQPQISTFLAQLVTIYQQAQVLPELSTALIATLPQIFASNISNYTADEWLALWQNLLGTEPALEMPLRLMNVAIAYKKQPAQQKRLWLGLAKEERSILDRALGLAESIRVDARSVER
jgi:tetratricopeptide (TPR) repeat protein